MSDQKEGPQANWEYRDDFKINDRMREIIHLTREAAEAEINSLKRKLRKLQYGS